MDLTLLDEAVEARRLRWDAAGVTWEIVRGQGQLTRGVSLRAESPSRVAELALWESGEADITHAELLPRITDPAIEHYEITTRVGLNGCLDDFERYMGVST